MAGNAVKWVQNDGNGYKTGSQNGDQVHWIVGIKSPRIVEYVEFVMLGKTASLVGKTALVTGSTSYVHTTSCFHCLRLDGLKVFRVETNDCTVGFCV